MARATQSEWKRRIEQWKASGLTGGQYAARIGVREGTLRHWKWQLGHERRARQRAEPVRGFVEVQPAALEAFSEAARFELVLRDERRLRIPSSYDEAALRRLLAVLEGR